MAERRMFAKTIVDSDMFIDMPVTARLLYYDLSMRADDDGFVNSPKKIMRMIGASEDDLRILFARNFVIPFESGVVVIRHWKIHNYIRKDTYNETPYLEEKSRLISDETGAYVLAVDEPSTECIRSVYEPSTQVRLGKDSVGKDRIGKSKDRIGKDTLVRRSSDDGGEIDGDESAEDDIQQQEDPVFASFWLEYPRKVGKGAARKAFLKLPRKTQALLLPALREQKLSRQWLRENGRYIPNPATWINQGRWEDEPESEAEDIPPEGTFLRLEWEERNGRV